MSDPAASASAVGDPCTTDPWDRFGWVMGAIWLVFLGFPIVAQVVADRPLIWRLVAIASIVAFAVVYVRGFISLSKVDTWDQAIRSGLRHLGGLLLISLAQIPLLGFDVFTNLPYIVALSMFSLPLVWAAAVAGLVMMLAALVPFLVGRFEENWFFVLIVLLVTVSTGLVRIFEDRGDAHRQAQAELTLAAERERAARDVHDVLGHSLTVVTVKAELAARLIDDDPAQARAELAQIQSLSRSALAEIRATVSGLRVASLTDEIAAAETALTSVGIGADLPHDLSVIDPRHRVITAWVLREAVTNVVRHSGATRCAVTLGPGHLTVSDNGRGTTGHIEGNGLRGIRERVAAAGGTLTLSPAPAGGTVLEVHLD